MKKPLINYLRFRALNLIIFLGEKWILFFFLLELYTNNKEIPEL